MIKGWDWDKAQREAIESPVDAHILVDAGPGTGKTAVACGRVAWLIDKGGIFPSNIWLISFTRTSIQEIRDRIKGFLKDEKDAYSVRIATLDSHAWMIHSGFDRSAELLGSYDDNIANLIEKIKEDNDGEISDYLQTVQHLIVDEGQDIVGIRADLVLEIISKLSDRCGVTVFSDAAQAIYGFSLDEESRKSGDRQKTLAEKIIDEFGDRFQTLHLVKVFRTRSPTLERLFTVTRKGVMKPVADPRSRLCRIHQEIHELADDGDLPRAGDGVYQENCFILFRRRAEVLLAASFMGKRPHRVRMSGLPQSIYPWVGACLSEHTKRRVTRTEFMEYWNAGVGGTPLEQGDNPEDAWGRLVRLAGESEKVVDLNLMRQRLGWGKPPADFYVPELGTGGPIIATIHASKGREADIIHLMMPAEPEEDDDDNDTDYDEETRVVFVGATRARTWLGVGSGYNHHFARRLEPSGRVFSISKRHPGNAQVEIGLENDIIASGIAGRNCYEDADTVRTNQERMYYLADEIVKARAWTDHKCGHIYRLKMEDDDDDIATLSNLALSGDLFQIAKILGGGKRRPPEKLKNLRAYGVRTIVLPPDSPECSTLHEPWARSGIMLAPVILGYTTEFFPNYYGRS